MEHNGELAFRLIALFGFTVPYQAILPAQRPLEMHRLGHTNNEEEASVSSYGREGASTLSPAGTLSPTGASLSGMGGPQKDGQQQQHRTRALSPERSVRSANPTGPSLHLKLVSAWVGRGRDGRRRDGFLTYRPGLPFVPRPAAVQASGAQPHGGPVGPCHSKPLEDHLHW